MSRQEPSPDSSLQPLDSDERHQSSQKLVEPQENLSTSNQLTSDLGQEDSESRSDGIFESEDDISKKYDKTLRQGPWLHPYPTVVFLSVIALIVSIVLGSFIVDRYYNKFFTPNYFAAPADLESVIKRVQESTVVVACGDSLGSGWAVDLGPVVADADFELKVKDKLYPYSVITNHHVIEKCIDNPDDVRVSNGVSRYISSLFTYDEENDLAIVATQAKIPTLPISQIPEPGWWSMALGSPFGLEKSVSTGNVMNLVTDGYIISTAPINPGNSGGPLVNSFGHVMGTNTFYLQGRQSINIAADVDLLCESLVVCTGDTFERDMIEECNAWCEFRRWGHEIWNFIFG